MGVENRVDKYKKGVFAIIGMIIAFILFMKIPITVAHPTVMTILVVGIFIVLFLYVIICFVTTSTFWASMICAFVFWVIWGNINIVAPLMIVIFTVLIFFDIIYYLSKRYV